MAVPTIESRLKRRFIVMSTDRKLLAQMSGVLPAGWTMTEALDLDSLGGFQEVLQHRFILLDLDGNDDFDPIEVVRQVRGEFMLNVPILCFGGAPEMRDEARIARADRFLERAEIVTLLSEFCRQFGWSSE